MDFIRITTKDAKNNSKKREAGTIEIDVHFIVTPSKDIMTRGKAFYAVYDEETGLWSKNEFDVVRLVDNAIFRKVRELEADGYEVSFNTMSNYSSGIWTKYTTWVKSLPDNWNILDNTIIFADDVPSRDNYATKRLPYALTGGDLHCYNELMNVLYSPEERDKIDWAIGAILTGDAKHIQKFITLYGPPGSGKSTVLNIIQMLVEGYYVTFNAKDLTGRDAFGLEVFKNNPLIAIQHDGDLSRIEDNSLLNSIVSHEEIVMNEKHKSKYPITLNCFLLMGTNKPVSISDSKSGLLRRLIDVHPTNDTVDSAAYIRLYTGIGYELGAIAKYCIDRYLHLGENYYKKYEPRAMMIETNALYNFMKDYAHIFAKEEYIQLKTLYDMYRDYCNDTGENYPLRRRTFSAEMGTYFEHFREIARDSNGKQLRSVYYGFRINIFEFLQPAKPELIKDDGWIRMGANESIFDKTYSKCKAQLANETGTPSYKWDNCETTLDGIDTAQLHYVAGLPIEHIVVDFDIKDESGQKSLELNLAAANKWPQTYAELSKSGQGIHLHYIWGGGDPEELARRHSDGVEIKVFNGNSSLRRKLSMCTTDKIAYLTSGLKLKERRGDMVDKKVIESEKHLRTMIKKCMNKEFHGATKPEIDFIHKLLEEAYESGMVYDASDMKSDILAFAASSSNQSEYCVAMIGKMKWKSDDKHILQTSFDRDDDDSDIVFYDVEVFKNLFMIVYKMRGAKEKITLINPTPQQVGELFSLKLVGFNNKRYDDHILYARYLGYSNEQLFELSQRIISKEGSVKSGFREAYSIAYTDIYDFSSKKQSLKKWEIELGLKHSELNHDWSEPIPESNWKVVANYCANDVDATEALFEHLQGDWKARKILADIAGLTYNHTTNQLTIKIVFGDTRKPNLNYVHLEEEFPGYSFVRGADGKYRNMYRGVDVGMGGYVYAEPGMYWDVPVLDVESMHPTSAIEMNVFGEHTKNYADIKTARLAIKHGDIEKASTMFDGKLKRYLSNPEELDDLSYALKIAINSAYGLTSAKFPNAMRDDRNVNNIVALRGALFMKTLQDEVQSRGYTVAHIKTDSIKIPGADQEIIDFCKEFAEKYGYKFEHESTYEKMCLINDAVLIGKYAWHVKSKKIGQWSAVGARFAEPYIFKTLFSGEEITFDDFKQMKSVSQSAVMHLDFNEDLSDGEHNYHYVGKVGSFVPIAPGFGGGQLLRYSDGKYSAVGGTKGYRWKEADIVKDLGQEDGVDMLYFNTLLSDAVKEIEKFGPIEGFADYWYKNEPPVEQEDLIGFDDCPPTEKAVAKTILA